MQNSRETKSVGRRQLLGSAVALVAIPSWVAMLGGCAQTAMRMQSPEALEEAVADVDLVRSMTVPFGVHPLRVDAVGLVIELPGTGSDPPLGPGRAAMIEEIQRRGVPNPDQFLSSPRTSLVKVRGLLPPGIQKGDPIDVEVLVPKKSKTTSLANGTLLEVRLREYVRLGGRYREGHVSAVAKGRLLVDPVPDKKRNPESQLRGVVLGGAVATKSRPLGLTLRPASQGVQNSRRIGDAINQRFFVKSQGRTVPVATPKSDEYIELRVHPRYKNNIRRYFEVIRSVAVSENDRQRHARIRLLERQLQDSISASTAALRLEAIGDEAIETLKKGLASNNVEVRFYASESLAYLDDPDAAATLAQVARDEPAFRARALAALGVMDSPEAYDSLVSLLDAASAEARYGAFHALWKANSRHPLVRGDDLDGQLNMHVVRSTGPAMVHVTRAKRPEVVVFGSNVSFVTPMVLEAGRTIMINGTEDGRVRLTRFSARHENQAIETTNRVDDVIRGIISLGGTYPDVVDALSQAKASRALSCRFEVDAVAQEGRAYQRNPIMANPAESGLDYGTDSRRTSSRLRPVDWPGGEDSGRVRGY